MCFLGVLMTWVWFFSFAFVLFLRCGFGTGCCGGLSFEVLGFDDFPDLMSFVVCGVSAWWFMWISRRLGVCWVVGLLPPLGMV